MFVIPFMSKAIDNATVSAAFQFPKVRKLGKMSFLGMNGSDVFLFSFCDPFFGKPVVTLRRVNKDGVIADGNAQGISSLVDELAIIKRLYPGAVMYRPHWKTGDMRDFWVDDPRFIMPSLDGLIMTKLISDSLCNEISNWMPDSDGDYPPASTLATYDRWCDIVSQQLSKGMSLERICGSILSSVR